MTSAEKTIANIEGVLAEGEAADLEAKLSTPEAPAATVVPHADTKAVVPAAIEGELPLDKPKAEALDKKISTAVAGIGTAIAGVDTRIEKLTDLVNEAKAGQIHVALGFASWTAYFTERVQTPVVSLTERKNVIALLHDAGMSQRDIATQVKVSVGTVNSTVQELNATREADAEKPAAKTVRKDGREIDRTKAKASANKAAAAKKSKADTGRATGKAQVPLTIQIGDFLVMLNGANASKFNEGQVHNLRAIAVQIERIVKAWDTNAANNKNAKA